MLILLPSRAFSSCLKRVKEEGISLGRPKSLSDKQHDEIKNQLAQNPNISQAARDFNVSRQTIMRIRDNPVEL